MELFYTTTSESTIYAKFFQNTDIIQVYISGLEISYPNYICSIRECCVV